MTKFKETAKKVIAAILTGIGILLIFLKLKEGNIDEIDLKDAYLEGKEDMLDVKIEDLEKTLDDPVADLDDDKVVEYWIDLE
jgi:hypothetical protein